MRHIVSAACGFWLAATGALQAEPVVLVELYTSQGCSSCPPADEFIAMLASDPRILPLALHVEFNLGCGLSHDGVALLRRRDA